MLRSIISFLLLPGIVAFLVPVLMLWLSGDLRLDNPAGLALLLAGNAILLVCTVVFHRAGKGTLAPWSPPQQLVTSGPYRHSSNPMYVGVLLILAGWAVTAWSLPMLVYMLIAAAAFHLRIVRAEEPWLAAEFGTAWHEYSAATRRWL